jgi:hypothetical protein
MVLQGWVAQERTSRVSMVTPFRRGRGGPCDGRPG